MKIRIGNYIVEVEAKKAVSEDYSEEDTKEFLDRVEFMMGMATDHLIDRKRFNLADEANQMSNDIYRHLKFYGYYDRV